MKKKNKVKYYCENCGHILKEENVNLIGLLINGYFCESCEQVYDENGNKFYEDKD